MVFPNVTFTIGFQIESCWAMSALKGFFPSMSEKVPLNFRWTTPNNSTYGASPFSWTNMDRNRFILQQNEKTLQQDAQTPILIIMQDAK